MAATAIGEQTGSDTEHRKLLAQLALAEIPKLLTLLDRNPHSPTYGCFDRNYWHYRLIDFASGMAQEFVWPLALVCTLPIPGNPYFGDPEIRRCAIAGIYYAAKSSHSDGSCDDYYPYERASGAAVFSLLACIDTYTALDVHDDALLRFLNRRARWLATHCETGRLSNHETLIALALELAARLTGDDKLSTASMERLDRLMSWYVGEEGWFPEYEGLDPGYHSLTISALARLHELKPSDRMTRTLKAATDLALDLVHPDGSVGGEYGSRNTYSFFPHGFELVGRWYAPALSVNDRALAGIKAGLAPCFSDDHIIGHHLWNYLLAWRDYHPTRPPLPERTSGRRCLPKAGLLIDRRDNDELYLTTAKGGVFKLFRRGKLLTSDTQFSVMLGVGQRVKNAVAHLRDHYRCEISADRIDIGGSLGFAKHSRMDSIRLIVLRLAMLTFGRFAPNLVRSLLQALLITGKRNAPLTFHRSMRWVDGSWECVDELSCTDWKNVRDVAIGVDQTSIYIAMSRTFQPGQLRAWIDLSGKIHELQKGKALIHRRRLE